MAGWQGGSGTGFVYYWWGVVWWKLVPRRRPVTAPRASKLDTPPSSWSSSVGASLGASLREPPQTISL